LYYLIIRYFVGSTNLAFGVWQGIARMADPADVAEYIRSMCAELARMADEAELGELSILLDKCVSEAGKNLSPDLRPPPGRPTH
jgi:hypothetical protein